MNKQNPRWVGKKPEIIKIRAEMNDIEKTKPTKWRGSSLKRSAKLTVLPRFSKKKWEILHIQKSGMKERILLQISQKQKG